MKTSWLNGSKRILSALLIAAALMFGWTPLGDGKALAATDKGKLFAQAAMLFQKDELAFGQEIYGKNYTVFSNTGPWCAVFVSVIANRCGIPTSVIPNWANVGAFCPEAGEKNADRFHPIINPSQYTYDPPKGKKNSLPNYQQQYDNDAKNGGYVPQVGDIAVWCQYWDSSTSKEIKSIGNHVGIVTNYDAKKKRATVVSGSWSDSVQKTDFTSYYGTQWEETADKRRFYNAIFGYYHPDWSKVGTMREPVAVTGISLSSNEFGYLNDSVITIGVGDTLQPEVSVTPSNAFWNPQDGIYSYYNSRFQIAPGYTCLYWKSSNTKVVTVDHFRGTLTSVGEGTATITAYAYADDKRRRADAVQTSFTVNVDSNVPIAREWYPYETQKSIELRTTPTYSSNNLYGTIFAGTELQIDLLHVTKAVVNSKTYWYAPVQVNDDEVVYCDISDQSVIRPMRAPSGNDWWNYKVVWASGLNLRSFADSNATGTVIMKIPKAATVELDLNHTMREPKYGDTWAFARYKQSDGTYIYGWVIESDSNYMQKQGKQQMWVDYITPTYHTFNVYDAPSSSANVIGQVTKSAFKMDATGITVESGEDAFWAYCTDYTDSDAPVYAYLKIDKPDAADFNAFCNEPDNIAWSRYEVSGGYEAYAYNLPHEDSPLVATFQTGSAIWIDEKQKITTESGIVLAFGKATDENGKSYTAWFDITRTGEPLQKKQDGIVEGLSVRGESSTYTLFSGHVSWNTASQYAVSMGGHLAVINDAKEEELIQSTLMSTQKGTAWIGGHATSDGGDWKWSNGDALNYWKLSASPNNANSAAALYYQSSTECGWKAYRDCANPYVDSFIVEVEETPRAWFTYRTKAKLNIRKSQSISGAVATTTAVGDYLTIDLLNVAMDSNKKYFFAPVLMSDGSILYCNIGDKTAIVPDLEPDEPAWTQYKALSSLYVRTFPNTWCDTGVLKTLSKNTILELDVSHKLRDPRFGNDWAYARYKQSDSTYLYGWVIAANSYVEQVKQTPAWYDYFANPGSTVYVYKTQNVDDTIVKTYTSGSSFQVDVNNMRQDQNGYLWAPVADDTGKELGYTDLSAAHAGSKSAAIPDVYCQSGWKYAYVLEDGLDVLAAPNEAAALVKHMNYTDNFWFDDNKCYTDAKGRVWTCIYAQKDYGEMADGGWVMLNENINYVVNTGVLFYPMGYTASYNGITYTLYSGYNSWSEASGFCAVYGGDEVQPVRMRLATVHNDAEQAIIEELLNATSTVDKAWIGASNTSGSWRWVDGTNVQYSQWGYNEPSGTGTELGVAASFDGSWYAHADALDIHIQGFITEQFTGIGLPQVKLPASTFYVDDEAFVGNSTIQSVVAPDGLQVIGTRAFADCANLKCITLPDSVSYIAEDAFENTPDVVIFASVGSYAWQWAEKQGIPHGTPYTE